MPSRQDARRWSAKLSRSIELRDGTELDTLADAAQFILGLHEAYQDRNSWRRASELLMEAAELGGSIEAATEQFELALSSKPDTCGSEARRTYAPRAALPPSQHRHRSSPVERPTGDIRAAWHRVGTLGRPRH